MTTFISIFVGLFVSVSLAQPSVNQSTIQKKVNSSKTTSDVFAKPSALKTSGFRFGYSRPLYAAGIDVSLNFDAGPVETGDLTVDYANVLTFGYEYLPIQSIGYIADLNYMEVRLDGRSANLARIQGSGAFKFNTLINLHAGLNISDLVSKGASQWDRSSPGMQAGLGFQLTRNFALEVNYSETKLTNRMSFEAFMPGAAADVDLKIRGYDLNFIGTF